MVHVKSCCLIGQRHPELPFGLNEAEEKCVHLKQQLQETIEHQITENHVNRFLCGLSLGIPMYAAEIILGLKASHPEIALECFLPFEEQAEKWPEGFRDRYFNAAEHCDREVMVQTRYTSDCEQICDRRMIADADEVIAVYDSLDEITQAALQYASQEGKSVIHIAPCA